MFKDYSYIKEINTNTVRLRLLLSGVVHYTYLPNSEVDVSEHQLNHVALVEITGNKKMPLLIDADEVINLTPDARKLVRELEEIVPVTKRAIVIKTLSHRLLANFYIAFNKPIVPTKVFNNYDDALNWLMNKKDFN